MINELKKKTKKTDKLEERGSAPLLQLLQDLGGWPILSTPEDEWSPDGALWVDLMARLRLYNNDIIVSMWIGPDGRNSDLHVIQVNIPPYISVSDVDLISYSSCHHYFYSLSFDYFIVVTW